MNLLRTQAEIVEAYRQRIRELNISFATVDAISGLPDGYTAKLMSPTPIRRLGERAIEGLNGALGIGFAVTVDVDQVEKVKGRWTTRKRAIDKKKQLLLPPASMSASMQNEVPTVLQITPELQAQIDKREHLKRIAKMGAKRRNKIMGKRARQRAASHAARMRWSKSKAVSASA